MIISNSDKPMKIIDYSQIKIQNSDENNEQVSTVNLKI